MNRHERRKDRAQGKNQRKSPLAQECVPLTLEQYELACKVGHAASSGLMPRQSFRSKYEEAKERGEVPPGEHLVLADRPLNHAAMAILDCFPDKTPEGDKIRLSALWRTIGVAGSVFNDPRAEPYMKNKGGERYIGSPLMEAVATVPMTLGEEAPLDAIFSRAAELAADWDPSAEPLPEN